MVGCSVFGCTTRSSRRSCRQQELEALGNISFHRFPYDMKYRQQWIDNLCRPDMVVTHNTTVCSLHFEDKYLNRVGRKTLLSPEAVPTIFPDYNTANIERFVRQQGHSKGRLSIKLETGTAIIGEKPKTNVRHRLSYANAVADTPTPPSPKASPKKAATRGRKPKAKPKPRAKAKAVVASPKYRKALTSRPKKQQRSNVKTTTKAPAHRVAEVPKPDSPPPQLESETNNVQDYEEFERKYGSTIAEGNDLPPPAPQPPSPEQHFVEVTPLIVGATETVEDYVEQDDNGEPIDSYCWEPADNEQDDDDDVPMMMMADDDTMDVKVMDDDDDEDDDDSDGQLQRPKKVFNLTKKRKVMKVLQNKKRRNLKRITKLRNMLNKLTNENLMIDDRIARIINILLSKCQQV